MRIRFRRRARVVGAVAGAFPLVVGMLAVPSSASPPHDFPEPSAQHQVPEEAVERETIASDNIEHLSHVPKQPPFDGMDSWGTDMAFRDNHVFVGNYDGFSVFDIEEPDSPELISQVHCPGGQGDVSVSGNLLFFSTDYPRTNDTCTSEETTPADPGGWEGMRVFDISDPAQPSYVSAIPTDCGSHTHTLVPDKTGRAAYLYVSSYGPAPEFPNCQPPHDKISIVKVPYANPDQPELVDAPVLFPDGGNPGGPSVRETTGCHDLTAFPAKDVMAGACMGDGILLDISDPEQPAVVHRARDDENFEFWHSATFNNTGDRVVFTDELGGGSAATCNAEVGPNRGANGIYEMSGTGDEAELEFQNYYKLPRHQSDTENCVAHNGSLIPVEGRDIMVQAWYQGGVSVWEFTDPENPREIAYFDRTPFDQNELETAGSWSAYYYNGHIYSSGIQEGLDVLDLRDERTDPAKEVQFDEFNPQTQPVYGG